MAATIIAPTRIIAIGLQLLLSPTKIFFAFLSLMNGNRLPTRDALRAAVAVYKQMITAGLVAYRAVRRNAELLAVVFVEVDLEVNLVARNTFVEACVMPRRLGLAYQPVLTLSARGTIGAAFVFGHVSVTSPSFSSSCTPCRHLGYATLGGGSCQVASAHGRLL